MFGDSESNARDAEAARLVNLQIAESDTKCIKKSIHEPKRLAFKFSNSDDTLARCMNQEACEILPWCSGGKRDEKRPFSGPRQLSRAELKVNDLHYLVALHVLLMIPDSITAKLVIGLAGPYRERDILLSRVKDELVIEQNTTNYPDLNGRSSLAGLPKYLSELLVGWFITSIYFDNEYINENHIFKNNDLKVEERVLYAKNNYHRTADAISKSIDKALKMNNYKFASNSGVEKFLGICLAISDDATVVLNLTSTYEERALIDVGLDGPTPNIKGDTVINFAFNSTDEFQGSSLKDFTKYLQSNWSIESIQLGALSGGELYFVYYCKDCYDQPASASAAGAAVAPAAGAPTQRVDSKVCFNNQDIFSLEAFDTLEDTNIIQFYFTSGPLNKIENKAECFDYGMLKQYWAQKKAGPAWNYGLCNFSKVPWVIADGKCILIDSVDRPDQDCKKFYKLTTSKGNIYLPSMAVQEIVHGRNLIRKWALVPRGTVNIGAGQHHEGEFSDPKGRLFQAVPLTEPRVPLRPERVKLNYKSA